MHRSLANACFRYASPSFSRHPAPATSISAPALSPRTVCSSPLKNHLPATKTIVSSPFVDFQKRHSSTFTQTRSPVEDVLMEEAIITMESPSTVAEVLQVCPIQHVEFDCCVCNEKVSQNLNKPAYEKGVVIVSCPGCQNLHMLGDNLGLNGYGGNSIEDIVNRSLHSSNWDTVGCNAPKK